MVIIFTYAYFTLFFTSPSRLDEVEILFFGAFDHRNEALIIRISIACKFTPSDPALPHLNYWDSKDDKTGFLVDGNLC